MAVFCSDLFVKRYERYCVCVELGLVKVCTSGSTINCDILILKRESLREFYRGHFCLGNPRLD